MTYMNLSSEAGYMGQYIAAWFLTHTDTTYGEVRFPNLSVFTLVSPEQLGEMTEFSGYS